MEAIVLAGGFGTRLAHVVADVPKPMAPVDGRPFLRYVMDDLVAKGIDRIVLAVGYKKQSIVEYFGDGYRGAEILYSEENTPLYTGGAVKMALQRCHEDSVFVINGDTLFDVDLADMKAFMKAHDAEFVIAAKSMEHFDRYGTMHTSTDGRILCFEEKKFTEEGIINGGIYLMRRSCLDDVDEKAFSLEKDILEKRVGRFDIYAYASNGYFIDIGIPEDYQRAQSEFKPLHPRHKAVFFDRDGTINVDTGHLYEPEKLVFIEGVPQLIRRYNEAGTLVIVVTNQAGIAKGLYSEAQMRTLHRVMNARLREEYGAHIDAFYFCPHHPDYTGLCHCRKPETGMLERAVREFDIDLTDCVMYGDKPHDMQCAKRMGIKGMILCAW